MINKRYDVIDKDMDWALASFDNLEDAKEYLKKDKDAYCIVDNEEKNYIFND